MKTVPCILLLLGFAAIPVAVIAQFPGPRSPDSLAFQGFITDPGGVPIDGSVPMTLKLYKDGEEVWSNSYGAVPVEGGVFSVYLADNRIDTVAFVGPMELGISVGGDPEMAPRTPLAATAFARAIPGLYSWYAEDFNWRGINIVGGAPNNRINDPTGTVGSTIGGGGGLNSGGGSTANTITGDFNTISGGHGNSISGFDAVISGGINNQITSFQTVIGGGSGNIAAGIAATVGGGFENSATGQYSTIPGGNSNRAQGGFSLAAGRRAKADHPGTFVWADSASSSGVDFISTDANQFLIRATGGVGIGTNAPGEQLHVLEPGGSSAVKLGGDGTIGPHGIVFDDDTDDAGVQLFWRTGPNQLVLERTSEGSGSDGVDAFVYDRDDQRFVFSGSRNANATFEGHLVGFDNTSDGSADGVAIRLGQVDAGGGNNFISFFAANEAYGRVEGNGLGTGVSYLSTGGDYAEYLPRLSAEESIESGDIVAVTDGKVTRSTDRSHRLMVVTDRPVVVGNMPDPQSEHLFERVAFVGQVPVKVVSPVKAGDYIVPSGREDGTGMALSPESLRPSDLNNIAGMAWESSDDPRLKTVVVEVGLDRAGAMRHAFENELVELRTALAEQQEKLAALEDRVLN